MSLTFSSQAKPALATIGAPLLALAPGAIAAVAGVAFLRRLRAAPLPRRLVAGFALLAGALLAAAAVLAGPLPAHSGIEQLFAPQGWWDIGPGELLAVRIPEALAAALALVATPFAAMHDVLRVLVAGILVAVALMIAAAASQRRLAPFLIAVAGGLVLILLSAAVGVYAAYVLLWLAAYLNFWAFALMLIALQRWRHGAI